MSTNVSAPENVNPGAGPAARRGLAGAAGITRYLLPLGRVFFAAIFISALFSHLKPETAAYAAQAGVPAAKLLVPLTGVLAFAGGLSIALGYRARLGAWLLVLFLVPVTVKMHAFWAVADPMMAGMQQAMFFKNLSMLGAALLIAHFGAGPLRLDARTRERSNG